MLDIPKCFKRKCKNLLGIKNSSDPFEEIKERCYCIAFPEGIPNEIAFGNDLHLEPLPDQENDIVYEKE